MPGLFLHAGMRAVLAQSRSTTGAAATARATRTAKVERLKMNMAQLL